MIKFFDKPVLVRCDSAGTGKINFLFSLLPSVSLQGMKKWLVLFLIVITTAGMVIPCCAVDNCCADQVALAASHDEKNTEGYCSPFFACATCPGFVQLFQPVQLVQPAKEKQVHHENIINTYLTTYCSSFWQPPRTC
jgi:hypothetical protein